MIIKIEGIDSFIPVRPSMVSRDRYITMISENPRIRVLRVGELIEDPVERSRFSEFINSTITSLEKARIIVVILCIQTTEGGKDVSRYEIMIYSMYNSERAMIEKFKNIIQARGVKCFPDKCILSIKPEYRYTDENGKIVSNKSGSNEFEIVVPEICDDGRDFVKFIKMNFPDNDYKIFTLFFNPEELKVAIIISLQKTGVSQDELEDTKKSFESHCKKYKTFCDMRCNVKNIFKLSHVTFRNNLFYILLSQFSTHDHLCKMAAILRKLEVPDDRVRIYTIPNPVIDMIKEADRRI